MIRIGKPKSARERALASIFAEVYREGKESHLTVRAYVENRISFTSYRDKVRDALRTRARDLLTCDACGFQHPERAPLICSRCRRAFRSHHARMVA